MLAQIRAFLVADVRGYTLFTQQRGDEAAAKLTAKFAQIAREEVEARAGEVIELRGDEALCVFASPRQAIRAAVELQDRFVEETLADPSLPLAVGIGLDAGEGVQVEGGYRGGALNLAARLCGWAGPGEILASREMAHLARRVEGVLYADRGEMSFKGLSDPVGIIAVSSESSPAAARLAPVLPAQEPPPAGAPLLTRRRVMVASLAVLVLVAAVISPIVLFGGDSGLARVAPNSVGVIDPETGQILRSIDLPNAPGSMAEGLGGVWVTAPDDGRVMRIDPQTMAVVDSTEVGSAPAGIAVGAGAVWVVDSSGPSLVRVSPDTNERVGAIPVGNGPVGVAVGLGAVWVTNGIDGTVSRIDPETNEVSATIRVGDGPTGIAASEDGVWVANSNSGTLVRIDASANTVDESVNVGNQPGPVAIGSGDVWVGNTLDGTVMRIEPSAGSVTQTIGVGLHPSAIALAGDSVWVTNEFGGTVSQVSTEAGGEAETIRTDSAPRGAAAVGENLWVSARGAVTSHRGGTLRIVGSDYLATSIDPALIGSWRILIYTNDGLVGFKRVGGADGLTIVPDLALSLPTVAEDGKTYRFQLREGIRYSTGDPIRASDFRRALERGFRIEGSTQAANLTIVGAEECMETPPTCDLSRGIETDDAAGTITFRLAAPDPAFLHKLALPIAYSVPAGTPSADTGATPVPATGPYMIDEYIEGKQLVLIRNPRFREWYAPAQPDGYPDRIFVRLGLSPDKQLSEVERGRADYAQEPAGPVDALLTRYAGQVHQYPTLIAAYLALNTSMPPFNDLRARKAVNYALDRAELVDLGGEEAPVFRITCQFLPPNLEGYEPYCPYTRDPNPAGQWNGPDLDRARKLIEASGTAGDTVVFRVLSVFAGIGYLAGLLEDLGYRVRVVSEDYGPRHLAAVYDSPDRVQATMVAWMSDYPAPSDFFDGVGPRCGSPQQPFSAAFCDPKLEALIRRAERAQAADPQRAGDLWAEADRRIVNESPYVALTNGLGLDIVSERVGNYQHNPQWGILLDQLWVR